MLKFPFKHKKAIDFKKCKAIFVFNLIHKSGKSMLIYLIKKQNKKIVNKLSRNRITYKQIVIWSNDTATSICYAIPIDPLQIFS